MASAEDPSGETKGAEDRAVVPSPGEIILKKLFAQFVVSSQAKLSHIMTQALANPLSKYLQRGEDPNFDQLLLSLREVASFCLRSLLTALNDWRKRQIKQIKTSPLWVAGSSGDPSEGPPPLTKKEQEYYTERLELAVEFIYCMTLVEILQKLPVHPVPEPFIHDIESLAFHHFRAQEPLKERSTNNPNVANAKRVADLYAEVIGVVSQVRFLSVRMRFFTELKNPQNSTSVIISVIEGLSFVRVKMYPVEELEEWFNFLQECANYMVDGAKGEKVRHAMSALLVDILTPVAAVIKYEMSMPAVKKLVSTLYSHFYDQSKKPRHSTAYIPLITILLAIAEDKFFLNNWHVFVTQQVLPNLKKSDTKLQRVALDSLYRLLWVYMIRVKGEGNVTTFNRLRPVVDTLFPRAGGRGIQLKDFPLNIFVKIIYFIARERVDNAMNDIILELVTKYRGGLNPERVIIGLRAFLMIADSLEKKEGDPPMPPAFSTMQSGSITRTKTKFLTSTLTEKIAKKIGIMKYYQPIRRALSNILKQLDQSVGNLVSTNSSAIRAPEEALGGERKPKLDLLKTCVAAIPRIMPEGMSKTAVVELLSRLTIHLDNDLSRMAFTALQNIVSNYPDWRTDILKGYAIFILQEIPDSCPLVLEGSLKSLGQLLGHWRGLVTTGGQEEMDLSNPPGNAIVWVESCALVTFCSYRSLTRKYSLAILKEVRLLLEIFKKEKEKQYQTVMDAMEKATSTIIKSYLATLSPKERTELRANQHLNLWWLADRSACFLETGGGRNTLKDAWSQCIMGLLEPSVLPAQCPLAVQLTWPYIMQRMLKAYYIVDPSSASERPDRLPTLRTPRGGYVAQPELFLWRNYLFFACCIAPPTSSAGSHAGVQEAKNFLGEKYTSKDLLKAVMPLIRSEDEIGEVFVSALGLANPAAFQDLIDNLKPWISDSLDMRKSDTFKKRRRRDTQRIHITRIFALAAENGCFRLCPGALNSDGELCHPILQFIEGIKQYLEGDADRLQAPATDLRLHYSCLIANVINSFFDEPAQLKLFSRETRYSLFYLVAGWSGHFWHHHGSDVQEQEERLVKQSRPNSLMYNVLRAMSALLCCGPAFEQEALRGGRYIYRWLENMLCSQEERIQQLGRKTVQLLLQNNKEPFLLNWVLDHCYSPRPSCASQCFHALCSTFAKIPTYPCRMISVLHVILYKTASLDHRTRERAMQLLHILDKRFFVSGEVGSRRPELLGLITGSIYSNLHVPVSEELAFANPELTLPLFSEMIQRFEETSPEGKRNILQIMKPWLRNIELVEESTKVQLPQAHVSSDTNLSSVEPAKTTNPVLSGSGWGSLEGTYLVLHNLLYLTAKYGDEYMPEIESLWCALCTWPTNIRVALNYLARLTCVAGNLSLMLQQAKRVIVYFSHKNSKITINELMRELQCVELITAEVHPYDGPPFYRLSSRAADSHGKKTEEIVSGRKEYEGESWASRWRIEVRNKEAHAIPLPNPAKLRFFASMKDILKIPCRQFINMHRSNFALILLSEVVPEVNDFDWTTQLPVLLHVITLGLDFHRPVVYEHSKRLLGNLIVLLACREDYAAACEARLTQYDMYLNSSSLGSLSGQEDTELERYGSVSSTCNSSRGVGHTSLAQIVHDLIKFVSLREGRRVCWPFQDNFSRGIDSFSKSSDLSTLVEQILVVFQNCSADPLLEKWTKIALSWATSCSSQQFASQSFQICRALKISLNTSMLREVLTRLAESASDQSDELQNYVLEIFMTLENAIDNTEDEVLHPSQLYPEHPRQTSDITASFGRDDDVSPNKMETSFSNSVNGSLSLPNTDKPIGRPPIPVTIQRVPSPVATKEIPAVTIESDPPVPKPNPAAAFGHRKKHSRGHSVTKIDIPLDINEDQPLPPTSDKASVELTNTLASASFTAEKIVSSSVTEVAQTPPTRPQSAGGTPKFHVSVSMNGGKNFPPKPQAEPPALAKFSATANENASKRISGPPIHLMDLFEPLPSAVSPPRVNVDATSHHHPQRPVSMIVTSHNELPPTLSSAASVIVSSSTISESLSTIGLSQPEAITPPSNVLGKNNALNEKDEDEKNDQQEDPEKEEVSLQEPDNKKEETKEDESIEEDRDVQNQCPKQDSFDRRSHNTSISSDGSENVNIMRVPSHPDLRLRPQLAHVDSLDSSPIMRARSVCQLQSEIDRENSPTKRRAYSGSREAVPGYNGLLKEHSHMRRSYDKLKTKGVASTPSSSSRLPLSHQNSPIRVEKERLGRRISADPERERVHSAGPKSKGRPRSMIETSSFSHVRHTSMDFGLTTSQDFLCQLFWTSVSLLESDYESEYFLAQHLFGKVIAQLDLYEENTYTRLELILQKMKWDNFSGIQKLLLKGLTLESTTKSTRELLSTICPHINQSIFEPSSFKGLPLNIMALLPELVLYFDKPTDICKSVAGTISKSCSIAVPQAHNSELMTVLKDIGHLFHLYSIQDFSNTKSIWLKSVCHYLCKGYSNVSEEMLKLLSKMLESGSEVYHQPVLWIILEYFIKLEEAGSVNLDFLSEIVTKPVSRFIKSPLWQDALEVLMRTIKNSSSLVRPPNSHIAVMELGIFQQTLPGPTLNFQMDLSSCSEDVKLAHDAIKELPWHRPHGCQRTTRERLLNVINASGPVPVLFSSPSVIFTDEQTLLGPFLSSSDEDDQIEDIEEEEEEETQVPSAKASTEVLDNSQPESVVINSIGDTFDFLNNYQYSDDEGADEEPQNMEGPFSSGREKTYSSSLTSSVSSLVSDEEEEDHHTKSLEVPESSSLEEYIQVQAGDDFSPPLIGGSVSLNPPSSSLEHSTSPPKPSSPSFSSVHFAGLEESTNTSLNDIQIQSEQEERIEQEIEEQEDEEEYDGEDANGEDEEGVKRNEKDEPVIQEDGLFSRSDLSIDSLEREEVILDRETVVDTSITTQVIRHDQGYLEDSVVAGISSRKDGMEESVSNDEVTGSIGEETHVIDPNESEEHSSVIIEEEEDNRQFKEEMESSPEKSDFVADEMDSDGKPACDIDSPGDHRLHNHDEGEEDMELVQMEESNDSEYRNDKESEECNMQFLDNQLELENEDGETTEDLQKQNQPDDGLLSIQAEEVQLSGEVKEDQKSQEEGKHPHEFEEKELTADLQEEQIGEVTKELDSLQNSPETEVHVHVSSQMSAVASDADGRSELSPEASDPLNKDNPPELITGLSMSDDEDDIAVSEMKPSHRVDAHRAVHFISLRDEEVEEMWSEHVSNLSRSKSPSLAVNTFYLFYRLFNIYRQQCCTLTEQACNFMVEGLWNVSTHFVVTAELMVSQLDLPSVYLDTEFVSRSGILDKLVFLVLEMHTNSESFKAKRKLVLENMNKCKEFLPHAGDSPHQKCLNLCHSIQQLHFHLLILVSAYSKLLNLLIESTDELIMHSHIVNISSELTDIRIHLDKAIAQSPRGLHEMLDHETEKLLNSMNEVQALRYIQELTANQQVQRALSLLHIMRSHYRDEQLFGSGQVEDVDVLVFAFAHYIAEGQEGVIGVSAVEYNLTDSLSHLMSQNVSLLSLLEKQMPDSPNGDSRMSSES